MATVKKAADVFGVSPSYLRRLCKAGKITFVNTRPLALQELVGKNPKPT